MKNNTYTICHCRKFLSAISALLSKRRDPRLQLSGMTEGEGSGMTSLCDNSNKAFTLIELLVVVLIIGILAAIALSQYQKAVWKSRYVQAKIMARSLAAAEEIYYMENGSYTTDFSQLFIETTAERISGNEAYFPWGDCELTVAASGTSVVGCSILNGNNLYLTYWLGLKNSSYKPGAAVCLAFGTTGKPSESDINYQICKSETNAVAISWGSNAYGWVY